MPRQGSKDFYSLKLELIELLLRASILLWHRNLAQTIMICLGNLVPTNTRNN